MKFIILALIICYLRVTASDNIDKLVNSIFKRNTAVNTTQKVGQCKCVPYFLCNNGNVTKFGEGLIDYRINDGDRKSRSAADSCNYLEVCCDPPEYRKHFDSVPLRSSPKKLPKCGVRNPEGVGFRITKGDDKTAQFGEFPWMLAVLEKLLLDKQPHMKYHGGASLIHPRVALTAAHLFNNKMNQFRVRAGEWDSQTKSEIFPHQDRDVVSIRIHPEFNPKTAFNDFALLFLNDSFHIGENVDVICLPAPNTKVEAGTRCFTSGWGKDKFGVNGTYQTILKKIDVPVVDYEDCEQRFRDSRLGPYFELSNTFMCAGGESNQDACKGDGGSPLACPVLNHPGVYEQYGVVSWGVLCGEPKLPGVYSAVSTVINWIEKEMKSEKLELAKA